MKRAEQAKEFFLQGYACSQAVARAFADLTGVDRETLEKIMLPFLLPLRTNGKLQ